MCLVLEWNTDFEVRWMALRLSQWRMMGMSQGCLKNFSDSMSQTASCPASVVDLYSASVDDRDTVCWSLDRQLIGPFIIVKMYPVVDFLVALSPAQSASE